MTSKRKKYKKKKNSEYGRYSKFKVFILIAIIIIIAFFVWQFISEKSTKKSSPLNIRKDQESGDITKNQISSVDKAINYAIKRLEIPEKLIKTYTIKDTTFKSVCINNQLGLTISNIFITDKVEEAGGQVIKTLEDSSGDFLIMKIFDPEKKHYYILKIQIDREGHYKKLTKLAIIIDDFGYFSGKTLQEFLKINKNICFAIIPQQPYSQEVMQKAYNQDRETIIHIPMEPVSYPQNDPGDNAIFASLSQKEIKDKMKEFLRELPLCTGANNHMGSLAMQYESVLKPIFEVLKNNDMFFIDSRTTPKSVGYSLAKKMGIPTYEVDFFIDQVNISDRPDKMTEKIINYAKNHNEMLIISHCRKKSLEELKQILENLNGKNIKIVPLKEIVLPERYVL